MKSRWLLIFLSLCILRLESAEGTVAFADNRREIALKDLTECDSAFRGLKADRYLDNPYVSKESNAVDLTFVTPHGAARLRLDLSRCTEKLFEPGFRIKWCLMRAQAFGQNYFVEARFTSRYAQGTVLHSFVSTSRDQFDGDSPEIAKMSAASMPLVSSQKLQAGSLSYRLVASYFLEALIADAIEFVDFPNSLFLKSLELDHQDSAIQKWLEHVKRANLEIQKHRCNELALKEPRVSHLVDRLKAMSHSL